MELYAFTGTDVPLQDSLNLQAIVEKCNMSLGRYERRDCRKRSDARGGGGLFTSSRKRSPL